MGCEGGRQEKEDISLGWSGQVTGGFLEEVAEETSRSGEHGG